MKMVTVPIICLLFLGCASISDVSHIVNNSDGYAVNRKMVVYKSPGMVSPSVAMSVLEECLPLQEGDNGGKCAKVAIYSTATGGYLPSLIAGSAAVGSAHLIGAGLSESGRGSTRIENSSQNQSGAGSVSSSVQEQNQLQVQ